MQKIGIIGAGISGLALAWYLKKAMGPDAQITLIEKQNRVGGWIETIHLDNFLFEQGPRGCRPKGNGLATLELIEELGLEKEVIGANEASRTRYLYLNKKLQPLPTGLISSLFSPVTKGIIPALLREWFVPTGIQDDESIYSFISRRLSPEIADRLIDPMTLGIYAGDIHELSMRSCFPKLFQWEREKGSLIAGMLSRVKEKAPLLSDFQKQMQQYALFSFRDGMKTLTERLAERLDCTFVLNAPIRSLNTKANGIDLELASNEVRHFDHIFSTLSPSALAPLVPTLKPLLHTIPSKSVTLVNLGFSSSVLKHKGFGYLVPSSEQEPILGVVWDSCTFPQQNSNPNETRLTVMMDSSKVGEKSLEIALQAIERHLGIQADPKVMGLRIAIEAIPQYLIGHTAVVKNIEELVTNYSKDLTLLGTGFYGAGVNDCIHSARNISQIFCKKNHKKNTIQ